MPLSPGQHRLGGTALAQCFSQLGDQPPDLDLPENLVRAFCITQGLLKGERGPGGEHVQGARPGLGGCVLPVPCWESGPHTLVSSLEGKVELQGSGPKVLIIFSSSRPPPLFRP